MRKYENKTKIKSKSRIRIALDVSLWIRLISWKKLFADLAELNSKIFVETFLQEWFEKKSKNWCRLIATLNLDGVIPKIAKPRNRRKRAFAKSSVRFRARPPFKGAAQRRAISIQRARKKTLSTFPCAPHSKSFLHNESDSW